MDCHTCLYYEECEEHCATNDKCDEWMPKNSLKYKMKLVIIEAMEINKETESIIRNWAGKNVVVPSPILEHGDYWWVYTPDGVISCIPGDFIIRKSNGKFYPCSRDTFFQIYETVEEHLKL